VVNTKGQYYDLTNNHGVLAGENATQTKFWINCDEKGNFPLTCQPFHNFSDVK
jgi:hypothetical protein